MAPRRGLETERLRRKRSYLAFCRTMPPEMLISSQRTATCGREAEEAGVQERRREVRGGGIEWQFSVRAGARWHRPHASDACCCDWLG